MPPALTLANAFLVLADETVTGSLRIEDGRIAAIDSGAAVPAGAVDCGGDMVAPGLVELHTDNLERHLRPRPSADWPHDAAIVAHDAELAGTGITTVFDAIRVGSIETGSKHAAHDRYARRMADEILAMRAAGALRISHQLHLRAEICSETLIEELEGFGPGDRVGILSLMDHTPGQRQFADLAQYETYIRGRQGLSGSAFEAHVAARQALGRRVGLAHEATAVAAAERLGATLASHDDTTAAHVARSASHGARLAEFPTTRTAAQACRAHGIGVVMGAPNLIRGVSHSGNVPASALAEADLLDVLSSDYVPAALLQAAVQLGARWDDLARALRTVSLAPARAAGLDDRGALQVGLRGDVIRVSRAHSVPVLRGVWVQGARVA